jgi:hypothetical protein
MDREANREIFLVLELIRSARWSPDVVNDPLDIFSEVTQNRVEGVRRQCGGPMQSFETSN